jgi:hypothetical protein
MMGVGPCRLGEGGGSARLRGGLRSHGPVPPEGDRSVGAERRCRGNGTWRRNRARRGGEGSQAGAAPPLLPALLQIVQQAAEGWRRGARGPRARLVAKGGERARRALRWSRRQRCARSRQGRRRYGERSGALAPREREAAGWSRPARRLAAACRSHKEVGAAVRASHLRARLGHERIRRLHRFETGWTEELHRRPSRGQRPR